MLSPTYEITTALSHTDELISPPYDIAIVTISYGRVIMSSVWDSMMSKKKCGVALLRRRTGQCGTPASFPHPDTSCCSCDPICGYYGDCCQDFRRECPKEYDIFQLDDGHSKATCFTINSLGVIQDYMFVSRCGQSRIQCETYSTIGVDHIMQFGGPVIDMETGVYYIHVACASCNEVPTSRLHMLDVSISCNYGDKEVQETSGDSTISNNQSFNQSGASDVIHDVYTQEYCHIVIITPTTARVCHPSRDSCPESCQNHNLINRCSNAGKTYTYNSYTRVGYYRNMFCAVCNEGYHPNLVYGYYGYFRIGGSAVIYSEAFSISLLLDLSNPSGPQLGSVIVECTVDGKALPAGLACGDIVCATGYVLVDDVCVKKSPSHQKALIVDFDVNIRSDESCSVDESSPPETLHDIMTNGFSEILKEEFDILDFHLSVIVNAECNISLTYSIRVIIVYDVSDAPGNFSEGLQTSGIHFIASILNQTDISSRTYTVTTNPAVINEVKADDINIPDPSCSQLLLLESEYEIVNSSLLLPETDSVYDSGFIILPNNSILLCVDV